ncbi:Hypothetical predicted protein, partial [Pelobates cultripes]
PYLLHTVHSTPNSLGHINKSNTTQLHSQDAAQDAIHLGQAKLDILLSYKVIWLIIRIYPGDRLPTLIPR